MAQRFDIVIIGNSAAGLAAVRTLRRYCQRTSIALIDREPGPAYSRVLTPYFVGGKASREHLFMVDADHYARQGVTPLFGQAAVSLDLDGHQLELADGGRIGYGKLLLAMGAEARELALQPERSSVLRHLSHADKLSELLQGVRSVTAVGAGLVSLPLLSHAGPEVERHLVVSSGRIFSRLFDAESAAVLENHLAADGVRLHKRDDVIAHREGERLTLELASGKALHTDLLLVGKGVVPNIGVGVAAGLAANDGLLIDDHCRTSHPDVFAAGDVAEGRDFVTGEPTVQGNWITAVEQGEVAALNLLGHDVVYPGSMKNNISEICGLEVAVVGYCFDDAPGSLIAGHAGCGRYRKVFLDEQQRVIGASLLGETNDAGVYAQLVRTRAPFPGDRWLSGGLTQTARMRQVA